MGHRIVKTAFIKVALCVIACCFACHPALESNHSRMNTEMLTGSWSSVMITYPNDPVFRDSTPGIEPGSAKLQLMRDRRFIFIWDKENITGDYHVDGQTLIFIIPEDGETATCTFDMVENCLTIIMDDGFRFDFERK